MLLRILIMFFLTIQASFGVSIVLDGTKSIESGSDCSIATYRFGTKTSYNGDNLDILLYVTAEDNEYTGGSCVDTQDGVVSFHIRDRDYYNDVASMDLQFIVVKHNTFTPVNVDTLTVTNFDLDSNGNSDYTLTDDVYYKNPLQTLLSNDSEVLNISGDFYDEYTVKLRGKNNGNCNDSATLTELSCRAGAIWKNSSTVYARVQNDNAYGSYNWSSGYHRLLQFSFEYKDIAPLISENNTSKECGTYIYSTNSDSWVEGTTHSQYDNNLNIQKNISIPNASQLKISFSGETEEDYDYLYIVDANGVEHAYSGNLNNQNDLIIDGSSVTLKFISDYGVQKEGVTVTVESLGCGEPTISLGDSAEIVEGNSGTTDLIFPINLSKAAVEDIVLHYEITDINTTANEDYILESNLSILIPKDANSASIIVKVKGDTDVENNESFSLKLLDATNAIVNSSSVMGTIINDDKLLTITPEGCTNAPSDIVDFNDDFTFDKNSNVIGDGSVGTVALYENAATINGVDVDLKVKVLSLKGLNTLALPSSNTNTVPKGFKLQKIGEENSVGFFIDQKRDDAKGTEYSTELEFSFVKHGTSTLVPFNFETQVFDIDNFANRTEYVSIKNSDYKFFQTSNPTHIVGTKNGEWSIFKNNFVEDSQNFNKNATVKFVHENRSKFTMKFTHIKNKNAGQYGGKAGFNVVFGKPNNGLPTCQVDTQIITPIAEYHFDECSWNGTVGEVKDNSGNNLDGTAKGDAKTLATGKIGRAGYFDGDNDFVEIANKEKLQLNEDSSFSLWIKPEELGTRQGLLFKHYNNEFELIMEPNGSINFYHGDGSYEEIQNKPWEARAIEGQWNHIVITREHSSKTLTWYINGQKIGSTTYVKNPTTSNNVLTIGRRNSSENYAFKGQIDEIKLFNSTLSDTAVEEIYNNETSGLNWDGTDRKAVVCEDLTPTIYISDQEIIEGNVGTTNLDFTVSLDKTPNSTVSFDYIVLNGDNANSSKNAYRSSDFMADVNKTHVILDELTQTYTIQVPIVGDETVEDNETFHVVLSNVEGAYEGTISAVGTIINDDFEKVTENNSTDLDQDNDGILDSVEYGTCSTGIETLMSFDDFGTGGRTTNPYTNYCYEDGDGISDCTNYPENIHTNDGEYTVVQHPNPDASAFSTWSKQGDHTGDENGRMMVVNASLQADEFYRRSYTVVPNASMTVDLWILNVVKEGNNIILPDISFRLENMKGEQIGKMINTGEIPENGIWNHYTLSINPENNSEIQIVLANNADGGGGNDLALDDIRIQQVFCDSDNDGIADYLDLDSDNDGIPDNIEAQKTQEYIKPNNEFDDSGVDTAYPNGLSPVDTDGDGIKDYLDLDSDNDGIADIIESGLGNNDTNDNNRTNANVGENGLDNNLENADDYNDTNGLAYEDGIFKLKESDDDTYTNGSNAHPMKTDFDYRDNAPKATLSISDAKTLEGDSGETKELTFMVSFDIAPDRVVTFDYQILDGDNNDVTFNAIAPDDYVHYESNGTISNYALTYPIKVTINGDDLVEKDEQFRVIITNVTGANVSKSEAIGTILNDDAPTIHIERDNSNLVKDINSLERKAFYTQIAGKEFTYSIVAYNGDEPYILNDTTVKVELLDRNSSTQNEKIYGSQYFYLNNLNREDIALTIARATRDAQFKLSYLLDENGTIVHGNYSNESNYNSKKVINQNETTYYADNFAIRPAGFKKMLWADDGTVRDHLATSNQKESYGIALAAGYEYELQVKALDDKGEIVESYKPQTTLYQEVNATLVFDGNKTKCADTSDKKLNYYDFIGGINSNKSFSNPNVGNYYISVKDENWTNIDHFNQGCIVNSTSNEADNDGRFGCNIGSTFDIHSVDPTYNHYYDLKVYFQPYMFDVNLSVKNSSNNGKDYLYMSNLFDSNKMSIVVDGNVTALAKSGEVTTNFTEGCLAHKVDLSLDYRVTTDSGVYDNNLTQLQTTKNTPVMIQQQLKHNDGAFSNIMESNTLDNNVTLAIEDFDDNLTGSTYFKLLYNIRKNLNETTNPIRIDFRQANVISEDSGSNLATNELEDFFPEGKANLNNSVKTFYYARVASLMESFPETNKKVIKTPLYVEIYCKVLGNRDWCDNTMNLQNIGRNTYKTDKGWYLAIDHNSTVEGKINKLISSNNTIVVNNANPVADFIDGRIDNIETEYANETLAGIHKAEIAIDSDSWLRFNTKETVAGVSGYPSSYSVTFKSISNETGVGKRGYMLNQRPQVDRNGKMSW